MSDTTLLLTVLAIIACGLLWVRYARQQRIEKRREDDDEFGSHRGGGPR